MERACGSPEFGPVITQSPGRHYRQSPVNLRSISDQSPTIDRCVMRSTLAGMTTVVPVPTALTASQCRAGRALIEWSQSQLSQAASIDQQTIADFERRFRSADETTRRRLRAALEAAGVVFISENGGGAGARLKFSREEVWE